MIRSHNVSELIIFPDTIGEIAQLVLTAYCGK